MSFVFFDTETTGIDTSFDQILQFGAIRTDTELNEIDRIEFRCRLLPHVVPAPGALRVTGLTLAQLTDIALPSHYEMVCRIRERLLAWSPAMFLGYNTLEFDEHLLRQAFYKTLHPLYLTNTGGNLRTDVLRMIQAASIFAPDALVYPAGKGGKLVLKLDQLAPANGFNHVNAHDAMGDVEATIFLCRLLMQRAPDVWSAFMHFSQKAAVVDYVSSEPVFSLSEFYGGRPYSWLVTSIGTSPDNPSEFYAYDLALNPDTLVDMPDTDLAARLGQSPKPIRRIRSNGSPIIMAAEDAQAIAAGLRLGLSELERRANVLHANEPLRQRLLTTFHSLRQEYQPSPHVELQIYDAFIADADAALCKAFHDAPWEGRLAIVDQITDLRLKTIGRQLIHVEHPGLLLEAERLEHDRLRARRLLGTDGKVPWLTLPQALIELDDLLAAGIASEATLLQAHRQYLVDRIDSANALLNG